MPRLLPPAIFSLLFALACAPAIHAQLAEANATQSDATAQPMPAPAATPAYDVATIKQNKSGSGSWGTNFDNGVYSATNVSLKDLLVDAYEIRKDLISGVPGPIDSVRFDVVAKIVDYDRTAFKKLTDKQQDAMMLPVLADRFKLKARVVPRMLPVYELTVVKGGPKFKTTPADSKQSRGISIRDGKSLTANGAPMP